MTQCDHQSWIIREGEIDASMTVCIISIQCMYDNIIQCGLESFHSQVGALYKVGKVTRGIHQGMYKQFMDDFKREEYRIFLPHLRVPLTRLRTISTQAQNLKILCSEMKFDT